MPELFDYKTEKVAHLIRQICQQRLGEVLVIGCGSGMEAAILAQQLGAHVVGIDVEDAFDPEARTIAELRVGDAASLDFADSSFDFVYSYHTLEHIHQPMPALQEMRRVLRDGGAFWIGTPNRHRLLGYLGSKTATTKEKIWWNFVDWKMRLQGRFHNEHGAHAGFSVMELQSMLQQVFSHVKEMTNAYYEEIYHTRLGLVKALEFTRLSHILFPAIYFAGRK
ncbi:MAG TPA: class I SAM-dependent methyltransferase [bacterium]|nr:class I SAM-dependent methyltransferase [bacterium]